MRILSRIPSLIVGSVAVVALLSGAASGQSHVQKYGEVEKDKTPAEIAAAKAAEQAYKRSLGNIPEQRSADPWGSVRSDGRPPKAPARAAAAGTKAKSSTARTDGTAKQ